MWNGEKMETDCTSGDRVFYKGRDSTEEAFRLQEGMKLLEGIFLIMGYADSMARLLDISWCCGI